MSTSAQQAGTLLPFPGICALHALLLSVYERLLPFPGICALHALLLSVYKWMVGQASREHLSGGDPLWYTTCALHA